MSTLTSNESNVASERFQAMLDEECNHCGKLRRNCNYWLVNELEQTRLWWKQDKDRLTAHETLNGLPSVNRELSDALTELYRWAGSSQSKVEALPYTLGQKVRAALTVDEEWEKAKDAMTGTTPKASERREYHANGTYWSGVPTVDMPCDFCHLAITAHDPLTHACPTVSEGDQRE